MKPQSFNPFLLTQLLAVTGFFAMSVGAYADLTWNSGGPSNNWSTAGGDTNWTGGVVWSQNENAIFNGTAETVSVTGANTVFNNITFGVSGFSIGNGAGSLRLANDQASTIEVTTGTATILEIMSNNVAGVSTLEKTGNGELSLGNGQLYTGTTTVSAGTLTLSGTLASTNLSIASGATFKFVTNNQIVWSVNPTGSGTFWIANGGNTRLDSGSMNAGGIAFVIDKLLAANGSNMDLVFGSLSGASTGNIGEGGSNTGRDLTVGALNTDTTYAGVIGADLTFTKVGTGTQTLSGINAYTGKTTVSAGTLQLAKTVSLAAANWTAAKLTVASGATLALNVGGTGEFAATDVNTLLTAISVAGAGTGLQAGAKIGFDTTTATGGTFTQGNAIADSTGANGGAIGVTKLGTGTLVLDKTNTYSGATNVNAGKLVVNGSISTSITNVNSGGTLGGIGTVGALTVASGGSLAPGNSAGILYAAGNTNLQAGSNFNLELNGGMIAGTNYDQLNVTGTVTLAGVLNLTINSAPTNGQLFFILANDLTDAITGTFSNASVDDQFYTLGGQQFQISYNGDSGTNAFNSMNGNDVVLMAVPEPNVAALLGGLGMVALLRRRRY